jgi:prolyl oligopeptidase
MFKTAKSRREVLELNFFGFRLSFQKIPTRRATLFAIALLFTTYFTSAYTESTAQNTPINGQEATQEINMLYEHRTGAIE